MSQPPKGSPSPRKESSFLKKIGAELSAFGGTFVKTVPSSKTSPQPQRTQQQPRSNSSPPPTAPGARTSHRPAPKAPEAFPGIKIRSRETLLPPSSQSSSSVQNNNDTGELDDDDFRDLTVLLEGSGGDVAPLSKSQTITNAPPNDSSFSPGLGDEKQNHPKQHHQEQDSSSSSSSSSSSQPQHYEIVHGNEEQQQQDDDDEDEEDELPRPDDSEEGAQQEESVSSNKEKLQKKSLRSELASLGTAELETELMRISISDLVPTEEAPAPPPTKAKARRAAPPQPSSIGSSREDAMSESSISSMLESSSVVVAADSKELDALREEVANLRSKLEEKDAKELALNDRIQSLEEEQQVVVSDHKRRVQELEMELDALKRTTVAPDEKSEEPTREELMAAIEAYRKKLEEAGEQLQKSEERKASLRDDLRKLIAKSKEIEQNARAWKQRAEDLEAKLAKTKALAREYAERCKTMEREQKDLQRRAAENKGSTSSEEVDELKAKIASLERRSAKAEAMAKMAVDVIKKSGSSDLKKELAASLQNLQNSSTATATSSSSTSTTAAPRAREAREGVVSVEAKADRRKSPAGKLDPVKVNSSEQLAKPTVTISAPTTITTEPAVSKEVKKVEEKAVSPASSPPTSRKAEDFVKAKSPRMQMLNPGSSEKSFLSPQVARKKQGDFEESARGSKTPTVQRKKEAELTVVKQEAVVTGSPGVARHKNPQRGNSVPNTNNLNKKPADEEKSPRQPPKVVEVKVASAEPTTNAFDMLEDMLSVVEKESGQTGLTGEVDNSAIFDVGGTGSASDYLSQMREAAQAEEAAADAERKKKIEQDALAKKEAARLAEEKRRDAHRAVLGKYLDEEQLYLETQLKDPTNPQAFVLRLLNKADKLQSEAQRFAVLDEAVDADCVANEMVLKVNLIEGRDLKNPDVTDMYALLSVKAQHETSQTLALPANGCVQWNQAFLFTGIDASTRVTITIMAKPGDKRVGVSQINLAELRGSGKEYYPIVDNSSGSQSVIRGMLTAAISIHFRAVKKTPVTVVLNPNSKDYQDAVRHGVAKVRRVEENKPREREYQHGQVLTPWQKEMDKSKPDLKWLAAQVRSGTIAGDDAFESVFRRTILHMMIIAGDIEMVEKCLAAGADPKKRDVYGMYPFHLAIVFGHFNLLKNLLPVMRAYGQSVHTEENGFGLAPIHLAVIFNRPKILEWLLDQGAEVDEKDEYGGLPIHKAAFVGSLSCMQVLVNRRAFVKAEDIDGNTPLMLSVMEGHWDVADYLLTNNISKASMDTINLRGDTPLWFALSRANKRFTRLFLDAPNLQSILTSPHGPFKWTLLMRTIWTESESSMDDVIHLLVDKMVERGIGLNQRCSDGKNAAFMASLRGNHKLLAWLATRGLDLLAEDENGNTPLHFASSIDVADVLVQNGASVDHKNRQGNTPLHAAYAFHPEVTDYLVSHNSNTGIKNIFGMKPSDCVSLVQKIIGIPYNVGDPYHRATCGLYIPGKKE